MKIITMPATATECSIGVISAASVPSGPRGGSWMSTGIAADGRGAVADAAGSALGFNSPPTELRNFDTSASAPVAAVGPLMAVIFFWTVV